MADYLLRLGDSADVLRELRDDSVDALVTDPPAGISFMGKTWDDPTGYGYSDGGNRTGAPPTVNLGRNPTCQSCGGRKRAGPATRGCTCSTPAFNDLELRTRDRDAFIGSLTPIFRECLRVMKPGAHGLVWALPRTSHWTATALEDAGFEVRDVVMHLFGTGFPKSLNVEKAGAGAEWRGWGTALKPAAEHWILVRKPLAGTVAENVLAHGTGALNIDASRIATDDGYVENAVTQGLNSAHTSYDIRKERRTFVPGSGRWPAHLTLDEEAAALLDASDETGASRFFYVAKAPKREKDAGLDDLPPRSGGEATDREEGSAGLKSPRAGAGRGGGVRNFHPTVKNLALMDWLIRLVTPPGGIVLDPFMGSGSTGCSAVRLGYGFVGIEREADYMEIAKRRIAHWGEGAPEVPLRSTTLCVTRSSNPAPEARTLEDEPMATKKTENPQYQNCAGVTCTDGSCVTCQVGTAERHHDELLAAIKDLGAHVGDVATTLDGVRKAFLAREPYTQHTTVAEHMTKATPAAPPPKAEPPKAEPPKVEPPKVEPPKAEPPKAEPPKAEPPKAEEPIKLTIEALRPLAQEWIKLNGRGKFVEMLAKFGAQKLPDVKDTDLPKLVEALGLSSKFIIG